MKKQRVCIYVNGHKVAEAEPVLDGGTPNVHRARIDLQVLVFDEDVAEDKPRPRADGFVGLSEGPQGTDLVVQVSR